MIFKDCKEAVNYTNCLLINARKSGKTKFTERNETNGIF